MATLKEKIGYGFGDMSSSMFWKIFSAYLPIFYASVFGLDLVLVGTLALVARLWDAVSDPMMGIIADRTSTKWGKYQPALHPQHHFEDYRRNTIHLLQKVLRTYVFFLINCSL